MVVKVPLWVVGEGLSVLALDALASFVLMRVYLKSRRSSALLTAAGWAFDLMAMVAAFVGMDVVNSILLVIFATLLFNGAVRMIEEEGAEYAFNQGLWSVPPFVILAYMGLFLWYRGPSIAGDPALILDEVVLALAWGSAGAMAVIAAAFIKRLEVVYERKARNMSWGLLLFGLHLYPYPFFKDEPWYAPIGLSASLVLIAFLTLCYISLLTSEKFMGISGYSGESSLEPGVIIVGPEKFEELKKELEDIPVLLFTRKPEGVPEKWMVYFITSALPCGGNALSSTDLPRIGELIYNYYHRMKEMGLNGVVILNALEYLIMYNGFSPTLKLLAKLRDFAQLHGGTLVIVTEREAFEDREWNLLKRLLE